MRSRLKLQTYNGLCKIILNILDGLIYFLHLQYK